MSGGIVDWTEGPSQAEEEDRAAEAAFARRYAQAARTRLPGGGYLTQQAAMEVAADRRYLAFIRWVAPMQWHVAAQDRSLTIGQIAARIIAAGPEPVLMRSFEPGFGVADWNEKVRDCMTAAMQDDNEDEESFTARWHATAGHVNEPRPEDEPIVLRDGSIFAAPKPRPAALDGYPRTDGRPDRPSKLRRKRIGRLASALGRRTS